MSTVRVDKPILYRTTLPEQEKYIAPETLGELYELLDENPENTIIYAGGTDLLLDMRMKPIKNKVIVDIKRIKELHKIEYREGKEIYIGPTLTIEELLGNDIIRSKLELLWKAMENFADFELRKRATIGGNLCNASPAADTPLPLLVYNASVDIGSKKGVRTVPLKEFFVGVKKTVLRPGEILIGIHVPLPPENAKTMYLRYTRASEDLMLVGIAGMVANPEDADKRTVRIAYGAVYPTPLLVEEIEGLFKQDKPLEELVEKAVETALNKVSPITDVRATKEYRLYLVETGTRYLLKKLLGLM